VIVYRNHGYLGICLMMQERYDEAEEALKRALVIDPNYSIAKTTWHYLPNPAQTGPPKIMGISDPFKDSKMKQSITSSENSEVTVAKREKKNSHSW